MTASSWDRSRRVASAASVLTVTAVVIGAVVLALTVGVPKTWWPHTGQVFTAGTRTAHHDPCALVVGPGKAYCERSATTTAAGRPDVAGAAWRLATAGAGVAALVVWRLRHSAGQRRH
ncbi:hypothetical protein [Streptomyces sp. TP-A0356]|uniref:hypothetical protein n=1 Tax=Streptomyces sp. TP-A0356 TaxID=1359208 RepID=UPI0006E24A79|nr:hypothetical protein [Streptomyces sp. TP-A0356]